MDVQPLSSDVITFKHKGTRGLKISLGMLVIFK